MGNPNGQDAAERSRLARTLEDHANGLAGWAISLAAANGQIDVDEAACQCRDLIAQIAGHEADVEGLISEGAEE